MIIKEIQITNFKSLGETVTIPIRQINLIFGPNSSGKSSILQCLAMLSQSVQDRNVLDKLLPKGEVVDLGRYQDFVHNHDTSKKFKCRFNFELNLEALFDEQLYEPAGDLEDDKYTLSTNAKKLKESLDSYKKIGLSFSFVYEKGIIDTDQIELFLGDEKTSVLSCGKDGYSSFNLQHNYWKIYWETFKSDILETLFAPVFPCFPCVDILRKLTKKERQNYRLLQYLANESDSTEKFDRDESSIGSLKKEGIQKIQSFLQEKSIYDIKMYEIFHELDLEWEHNQFFDDQEREDDPVVHDSRKLSSEEIERLKTLTPRKHFPDAAIEIFRIFNPHNSFYQNLEKELSEGGEGYKIYLKLYNLNESYFNSVYGTGFLPEVFDEYKADQVISKRFIKNLLYNNNECECECDFFHPGQLVVLVSSFVGSFLKNISYLGPLRKEPERYHIIEDKKVAKIGKSGANVPSLLYNNNELVSRVNKELNNLQAGYQLKIVKLTNEETGADGVFLIQFIDNKTGTIASIKDVGFGFSQLLPIIVQCQISFYKKIFIEQPELHLHPALQAELGDMFIKSAMGEENMKLAAEVNSDIVSDKNNIFFIETHSEHLILRLLRRIRETTAGELPPDVPSITPNDLSVIYVEPGEKGSQVIHLPINDEGEFLRPWPQGFFAERARELF